jgi:ubiquinone/menaquinone biosynthesis C-methylase UbiE
VSKIEKIVKDHYAVGNLAERILEGLKATGADIDNLTIEDIAAVDEFHIGGRKATQYAISKIPLMANAHVLDVGCGIGGAARTIVSHIDCKVTGIDLTSEYIEVAQTLSRLTGLDDRTEFHAASALSMPFEDQTFDAAITIHVAMNIKDRDGLYKEIARVTKPGAVLCIYDVMKKGDAPIAFPVPWAQSAEASHLVSPDQMAALLQKSGFEISSVEDRSDFAMEFIKQSQAIATAGASPLGAHLYMGQRRGKNYKMSGRILQTGAWLRC